MERGLLEEQKSDREGSGTGSLSRPVGRLQFRFTRSRKGGSSGSRPSQSDQEDYLSVITSQYTAQPTYPPQGSDPFRRSIGNEGFVKLPDETGKL
jgi:hypothetical protein